MHEASAQNAVDQYDHTRFSHENGALAFYNNLKYCACRMVQPPDNYLFRRKFLHGLPHLIIKSIFEARRISTEHPTIEEILEEVRCMETAQKAINMHMRLSHTGSGGKSSQGQSGSNPYEKKESRSSLKGNGPKYVKKGDKIYHWKMRFSSKREGKGGMNHQTKGHQTQTYDKGA